MPHSPPPDWNTLIVQHGPAVWRTCWRMLSRREDAEDAYQQVFLDAYNYAQHTRVHNFAALLRHIATRRSLERLRRRRRERVVHADLDTAPGPDPASPQHDLEQRELADHLRSLLPALPPRQAEVFCLRAVEDLDERTVAQLLGISTSHVRVLLHRARAALRQRVDTFASSRVIRRSRHAS